ncbi:STAS domain-containing protein [Streptacidiphilus sp. MAP12-20]|uniref:STAS domain-containing protein n=1 Tax=Streptacidiphilus sp. MAP12-20 TaxID=3156299 RepID=UPI003512805C
MYGLSILRRGPSLALSGEIDLASVPLLRHTVGQILSRGDRTIACDLTAVTFCDISGVNAFLEASRRATAAGGSLQLTHVSPKLTRLLTLTGTSALLLPHAPTPTPRPANGGLQLRPPGARR